MISTRLAKIIILSACLGISLTSFKNIDPPERKLPSHFDNLYMINNDLYRSDQPSGKGMEYLDSIGIQVIINFRHQQTDSKKATGYSNNLIHYPINTNRINANDIYQVLKLIRNSPKPVLIHCKHGSDRTGAIIAAYRMVEQNWTTEKAIEELRQEKYGYHEGWFSNIIELLNTLDSVAIRESLEK